jgi:glycerol-3-phosphate dehydrogenase
MARELGWDAAREQREVDAYLARVVAEQASQLQADDAGADRVRLEAPEIGSA